MARAPIPLPVVAALLGVACLSLMDAFMKGAALAVGAFSAAWLRAVIGTAIMLPVWLATGARRPPRAVMKLHIERGVVSCFMALSFFYALTKLPIAETIAISFIAPLVALYLARALLGEVIARSAIWGSLLGFAGTLVIVSGRLGRDGLDRDAVLGLVSILVSALLYAYNFIVMRRQSQVAGPVEVALFHSLVTALLLALAAPLLFQFPGRVALGETAASAALTVIRCDDARLGLCARRSAGAGADGIFGVSVGEPVRVAVLPRGSRARHAARHRADRAGLLDRRAAQGYRAGPDLARGPRERP